LSEKQKKLSTLLKEKYSEVKSNLLMPQHCACKLHAISQQGELAPALVPSPF
jgi:hypothetical protein